MTATKKKPLHFGLYGEKDFLLPDFMHCEPLSLRTQLHNNIINEHIHSSLFQIFFLESGELHFSIDNKKHLIKSPAIITVPENTLHGLTTTKKTSGKVLTLSTSFVETFFNNAPDAMLQLSTSKIITEFENSAFNETSFFINQLYTEMIDDRPEKKMVLQSYFNLLLSLTYRLLKKKSETPATAYNRNSWYFKTFQKNIKQFYTPMKTIKEYAKELNITRVHLNRVCQAVSGKPALQIVHGFLILEAQKFLKHTDLHISEVAYRLNFEDPAYFSRFFKKYTGISPKEFREKN
jgi:AraC family transcriptional activator of pobA